MQEQHNMLLKIVFVGDSGVGKTSLLRREADNNFTEEHVATIGVDFKIRTYDVGKIKAKAQMWDTAGQQRFRAIQKPYYKNANAILLCFSLNDRATFVNLTYWLDELKNYGIEGPIYLVGCKSDMQISVPTDEILTFAEAYKVGYIQTSARENIGVHDGFKKIIEETVQANLIKMAFNKQEKQILEPKDMLQGRSVDKIKTCSC